jgi:hypothetical protein
MYSEIEIVLRPSSSPSKKTRAREWKDTRTGTAVFVEDVEGIVSRAVKVLIRGGFYAGREITSLDNVRISHLPTCPDNMHDDKPSETCNADQAGKNGQFCTFRRDERFYDSESRMIPPDPMEELHFGERHRTGHDEVNFPFEKWLVCTCPHSISWKQLTRFFFRRLSPAVKERRPSPPLGWTGSSPCRRGPQGSAGKAAGP